MILLTLALLLIAGFIVVAAVCGFFVALLPFILVGAGIAALLWLLIVIL